jgi:cytochrome P450
LLEMKMAIAMLLGRFDIERVGTRDGRPAQERFAFAMGPVGLEMTLRKRATAAEARAEPGAPQG